MSSSLKTFNSIKTYNSLKIFNSIKIIKSLKTFNSIKTHNSIKIFNSLKIIKVQLLKQIIIILGYYADPEAQCQVFHICTADGQGGLAKYSFLCPNGTIFNQNYFICDWWFNFDCAEAEGLYGRNDEIAAERDALAGGEEEAPADSYGAAPEAALDAAYYDYEEAAPLDEYAAEEVVPTYEAETEAPLDTYAADEAVLPTAIPTYEESESREARRFSGRRGRNGRRNNSRRQGRRQGGSRRNNNRRGQRNQQGRRGRNFRG